MDHGSELFVPILEILEIEVSNIPYNPGNIGKHIFLLSHILEILENLFSRFSHILEILEIGFFQFHPILEILEISTF